MDVSSSAVIRRHLLDPIKLDATIHRSLKPSCHTFPALECKVNIEYVKVRVNSSVKLSFYFFCFPTLDRKSVV